MSDSDLDNSMHYPPIAPKAPPADAPGSWDDDDDHLSELGPAPELSTLHKSNSNVPPTYVTPIAQAPPEEEQLSSQHYRPEQEQYDQPTYDLQTYPETPNPYASEPAYPGPQPDTFPSSSSLQDSAVAPPDPDSADPPMCCDPIISPHILPPIPTWPQQISRTYAERESTYIEIANKEFDYIKVWSRVMFDYLAAQRAPGLLRLQEAYQRVTIGQQTLKEVIQLLKTLIEIYTLKRASAQKIELYGRKLANAQRAVVSPHVPPTSASFTAGEQQPAPASPTAGADSSVGGNQPRMVPAGVPQIPQTAQMDPTVLSLCALGSYLYESSDDYSAILTILTNSLQMCKRLREELNIKDLLHLLETCQKEQDDCARHLQAYETEIILFSQQRYDVHAVVRLYKDKHDIYTSRRKMVKHLVTFYHLNVSQLIPRMSKAANHLLEQNTNRIVRVQSTLHDISLHLGIHYKQQIDRINFTLQQQIQAPKQAELYIQQDMYRKQLLLANPTLDPRKAQDQAEHDVYIIKHRNNSLLLLPYEHPELLSKQQQQQGGVISGTSSPKPDAQLALSRASTGKSSQGGTFPSPEMRTTMHLTTTTTAIIEPDISNEIQADYMINISPTLPAPSISPSTLAAAYFKSVPAYLTFAQLENIARRTAPPPILPPDVTVVKRSQITVKNVFGPTKVAYLIYTSSHNIHCTDEQSFNQGQESYTLAPVDKAAEWVMNGIISVAQPHASKPGVMFIKEYHKGFFVRNVERSVTFVNAADVPDWVHFINDHNRFNMMGESYDKHAPPPNSPGATSPSTAADPSVDPM